MPAFLIPIFIIFAIVLFSTGGDILKNVWNSISDIRPSLSSTKTLPPTLQKSAPPPQQSAPPPAPPPASVPQNGTTADKPVVIQIPSTNSLYFQKVTISSLSTSTPSLITLRANLKQGEEISITGWKVRGKAGSFQIPLAIARINPFSSLDPGDSIKLKASDTVYLSSARGPFGLGKHFRPNMCMGYLRSSYAFPLSVPSSCDFDKPKEETILFLLQACQDFLLKKVSYGNCTIPDYAKDISVKADTECTSYIERNFGYTPCFNTHQEESGFLRDEWHVYMNMNLLTQKFDTIELLDQNGLLVDQEKYSL